MIVHECAAELTRLALEAKRDGRDKLAATLAMAVVIVADAADAAEQERVRI
jgi:hypothetical protein